METLLGDRSKKVGVIDSEYIVHQGIPSLGGLDDNKVENLSFCTSKTCELIDLKYLIFPFTNSHKFFWFPMQTMLGTNDTARFQIKSPLISSSPGPAEPVFSERVELSQFQLLTFHVPQVRRQSYSELDIFNRRWSKAIRQDKCWVDPYWQPTSKLKSQLKKKVPKN
eukprot:Gb_09528 [translate_table: standard]